VRSWWLQHAKLVAVWVGKDVPAPSRLADRPLRQDLGTNAEQSLHLRLKVARAQVEVNPVLAVLTLPHMLSTNNHPGRVPSMGHVALYLRISRKTKTGLIDSVESQERQGRDYAGWVWPGQPIVIYSDDAISAADEDKWRPGFEKLHAAIQAGQASQIWCAAQDRLQRVEAGWFVLAAELVTAGLVDVHTRDDGIVHPLDAISGIKAVLAAEEIRKLKKRINARLADNAAEGIPAGSRPFGYRHGTVTVDGKLRKTYVVVEAQAEIIRESASRVLAGWSLSSIAADLRRRGIEGPHRMKVRDAQGNPVTDDEGEPVTRASTITAGSVRTMLTSPTMAGWRVHRGEIVGEGNWEPILDRDTWQACRARLSAARTVDRADGGTYPVGSAHTGYTGRKYALTGGLARCGVCGGPLGGQRLQAANGKPYLICLRRRSASRPGSCVGIMLEATEKYVVDELFRHLDRPEFLAAISADDHTAEREKITSALGKADVDRADLAGLWGAGELTVSEWSAARRGLDERERKLRAALNAIPSPPARIDIATARASWGDMDLGEQRAFIREFINRVEIGRAVPGTKGFDETRVTIFTRANQGTKLV
jgi:site-specific DNA recombinase